jgi:hypothetical protein
VESLPARKICKVGQPSIEEPGFGPGFELMAMFGELKIPEPPGCGCKSKARQMNRWGVAGCREHVDEIIGWIREAYDKSAFSVKALAAARAVAIGLAFHLDPLDPIPSLVAEAIRRAEIKSLSVDAQADLNRTLVAVWPSEPDAALAGETVQDALRESQAVVALEATNPGGLPATCQWALGLCLSGAFDRIVFIAGGARLSPGFLAGLVYAERHFRDSSNDAVAVVPTPWMPWTPAADYQPIVTDCDATAEELLASLAVLFTRRAIEHWGLADDDFKPSCFADMAAEVWTRSRQHGGAMLCTEAAHAVAELGDAARLSLLGYE